MTATPLLGPPDDITGQNYDRSQMYEKKNYLVRFRRGPR